MNTLLYAQLLYEIISFQNIIMSKKRTFTHIYPVCWFLIDARVLSANSGSMQSNTRRVFGYLWIHEEPLLLWVTLIEFILFKSSLNACWQLLYVTKVSVCNFVFRNKVTFSDKRCSIFRLKKDDSIRRPFTIF